MTNEEFIIHNRDKDIRSLALKKMPEGVDAIWCLKQIEGYQIAKRKLPQWAATEGIWYPSRLPMEQCSSEATAIYKRDIVKRLCGNKGCDPMVQYCDCGLVDITGGFGVDFSYMAKEFSTAFYIEQQQELCNIALHNFPLLGLPHAKVVNADSCSFLNSLTKAYIIYSDPARRDNSGKKIITIEDCTPDISAIQHILLSKATHAIVKLSPMLDITQALRTLNNVSEVHIVSVKGECKELLFVLSSANTTTFKHPSSMASSTTPIFHCMNLLTGHSPFITNNTIVAPDILPADTPLAGKFLFEPNASILKAGVQNAFAKAYGLHKLHPLSNIFICNVQPSSDIPARAFRITDSSNFSKRSLKRLFNTTHQCNLTIRNFPSTVQKLRKRLNLKEGGSDYLFATTLSDGSHILLKCINI